MEKLVWGRRCISLKIRYLVGTTPLIFQSMRFIFVLLCSCCLYACGGADDQRTTDASPDYRATFKDLDGKRVNFADYKGKAVFINIWATWCKPCRAEMPSIAGARDRLAGKNIVFLLASDDAVEDIKAFEREQQFGFHYLQVENMDKLSISALPTTYIYDAQGELVYGLPGSQKWDDPEHLQILNKAINVHE